MAQTFFRTIRDLPDGGYAVAEHWLGNPGGTVGARSDLTEKWTDVGDTFDTAEAAMAAYPGPWREVTDEEKADEVYGGEVLYTTEAE